EHLEKTFDNFYQHQDSFLFLVTNVPKKVQHGAILAKLQDDAKYAKNFRNEKSILNFYELIKNNPDKLQIFDPTSSPQRAQISAKLTALQPIDRTNIHSPDFKDFLAETLERLKMLTAQLNEILNKRTDIMSGILGNFLQTKYYTNTSRD